MQNLLELLKSEQMVSFYIKYSICYLGCIVTKARLNALAKSLGYKRKNKNILKKIADELILCAIFFVPYVGWIIPIIMGMAFFSYDPKDKNIITNDDNYEKIIRR